MHDGHLLSVKHFTFCIIYIARGPWAARWACISGVRIFKFRVRGIPQVLDSLRNGSALMTCTALVHAAWACSCMVCFSAGHILPELHKFICATKLWSADCSRPQKNCGSESAVDRDRSPQDTGIWQVSSDGSCQYLKSTIYWYDSKFSSVASKTVCRYIIEIIRSNRYLHVINLINSYLAGVSKHFHYLLVVTTETNQNVLHDTLHYDSQLHKSEWKGKECRH